MSKIRVVGRAAQPDTIARTDATEYQICKAFVEYVAAKYPQYIDDLMHIANEGKRSWTTGKRLKRIGLRKGVADYFLAVPKYGAHGLWLEIKTRKGRPTREQLEFIERRCYHNYAADIVYGLDEAIEKLDKYLDEYK